MPLGFRAGAVAAGIKASGRRDLGVLATTGQPAAVAATFTTNRLSAAPVRLSQAHLAASGGWAGAVLTASGSANAATGPEGDADQLALAEALAAAVGVPPHQTLALATGVIGTRLPVDRIRAPIADLVAAGLSTGDDALAALAEQLCTTDTHPKWASVRLELPAPDGSSRTVTVAGIAKGVGMIHPRMATMLALVLTDATVDPPTLHGLLAPAVERTWNQLTVDGDTSTNDTVLLLASGAAGTVPVQAGTEAADRLGAAIEVVARSLARQQAADGEGATTLITCQVSEAPDDATARAVARAVVGSSLVKAAVHGRDPNWGRIAAAVGNAEVGGQPVPIDVARLAIAICGVPVFEGCPLSFDRSALSKLMAAPEVVVAVELGLGTGWGEAFGCDLSEGYVVENSVYTT
ncbi:MAG: bifunctional glutamate N-acetyltransferase/amino-acid acetyltransferase ArgJ [Chloroflexi bacterium]|nr:bifunctional glutamate N-acetyltransferase/amino-acid acetyltransferase ArgJ [Chloroflexota bacterium]